MWRGSLTFETPDAVGDRLPRDVPVRWADRRHPGRRRRWTSTLSDSLLRGGALPLRRVRHGRVRDVRRLLLLVAEVHRADARRAARQDPLLAAVHRLPHDVPHPALAGRRGHAPPVRGLPARGRLHALQPDLDASGPSSWARRCCRSSATSGSTRNAPKVEVDDPWGWGGSLEWATSCPPPRHNFLTLPRIRSERPAFDLHHPEVAAASITAPDDSLGGQHRRRAASWHDDRSAADRRWRPMGGIRDRPDGTGSARPVKVETWLFGSGAFFFVPLAIIYGIVTSWHEPVGPRRSSSRRAGPADRLVPLDHLAADRPPPGGRRQRRDLRGGRRAGLLRPVLAGGRCRSRFAAAMVFAVSPSAGGWSCIGAGFGAIALRRLGVRVLPRRARPLRRPTGRATLAARPGGPTARLVVIGYAGPGVLRCRDDR